MAEYVDLDDINVGEFFSTINNIRSIYILISKVLVGETDWNIEVGVFDFQKNSFDKVAKKKFKANELFSKRTKTQVLNRVFTGSISGRPTV